jgi:hypothetical protein
MDLTGITTPPLTAAYGVLKQSVDSTCYVATMPVAIVISEFILPIIISPHKHKNAKMQIGSDQELIDVIDDAKELNSHVYTVSQFDRDIEDIL